MKTILRVYTAGYPLPASIGNAMKFYTTEIAHDITEQSIIGLWWDALITAINLLMTTSLRRRARRISGNRIAPRDRPGPNHHRPRLGLRYRHRPIIEAAKAYRTKSGIRVRIFPTVPDPTPASNPTPAFDIDGPATLHNLGIAPPQAIGAPDTNAVAWTFTLGGDVHQALALHNDPGVASAPLWHFADRQPWTVGKLYAMLQVSQITCHASVEG